MCKINTFNWRTIRNTHILQQKIGLVPHKEKEKWECWVHYTPQNQHNFTVEKKKKAHKYI